MTDHAYRYLLPRRQIIACAAVKPLTSADFFARLRRAIENAKKTVLLEFYIFRSDETGHAIAELLIAAKARGVRVCLIYDSFGSWGDSESVIDYMLDRGIEVIEFHPLFMRRRRWFTRNWFHRDHRKIVVVDTHDALLSSGNIGDEYLNRSGGGYFDVAVALTGPIVAELEKEFWRVWKKHGGPAAQRLASDRSLDRQRHVPAQLLANREYSARRIIESSYVYAIDRAKASVLLANAYFVPNLRIRRVLIAAVKRGVDVQLLLPGDTDHLLVHFASAFLYGKLLKAGVRIYLWKPAMMHAKFAVVDDVWASVGSYNFDALSLHRNLEIAVAFEQRTTALTLREIFQTCLAEAQELTYSAWQSLPWSKRLLQWIAHKFRDWL